MNALDVVLALVLVAAVAGGLRVGFVARVITWVGVLVGLLAASFTVPLVLGLLATEAASFRFVAGLAVLAFTVTLSTAIFQAVAATVRTGVDATPLSKLDRILGAVAGGIMVLAMTWFLLPAAADTPGLVASQARGSATLALVDRYAPPPPTASAQLRGLIDSSRFPEVWDDLRAGVETGPPPEDIAVDATVVARATESTVHVESRGCGRRYDGSGVTIGTDLVVTNAHVVAGAEDVVVRRPDGAGFRAAVVRFDPARDLALLAVEGLDQEALPLAEIPTGADGVAIGYPGGQRDARVAPLRIEDRRRATGRDIYGEAQTERDVLFLSAVLRQGDSGSPVVDTEGNVTGIVFAISPDEPSSAFALDLPELEALLEAPRVEHDTGRCIG